jgi:hypothetical protein
MYTLISLFIAGIVLAVAGTAFAGEPTSRPRDAVGTSTDGAEQALTHYSATNDGRATAPFAETIPAARGDNNRATPVRAVRRTLTVNSAPVPSGPQLASQL